MRLFCYAGLGLILIGLPLSCGGKPLNLWRSTPGSALTEGFDAASVKGKRTEVEQSTVLKKPVAGIKTYSFTISASRGGSVTGILFMPDEKGKHPGVFFMHWLGGTSGVDGGPREFYAEAAALAATGYVCVVPQGTFPWYKAPKGVADDASLIKDQIDQMSSVLVYLSRDPQVDTQRLAFVGHDYGAMHGFLLLGKTDIFKAAVFMTPVDTYAQWNRIIKPVPSAQYEAYAKALSDWDPVRRVADLPDIPVFYQFADNDQYVSEESAKLILAASAGRVEEKFYASGHALNEEARQDRTDFLTRILGSAAK